MSVPALAKHFDAFMDPGERLEYQADLAGNILEAGETITGTPTITMGAEGTALGMSILTVAPYQAAVVNGTSIKMWVEVDVANRNNPAWFSGVDVPVQITIDTSNVPSRRRERTVVIHVEQQ
jgi:hypothetical protein